MLGQEWLLLLTKTERIANLKDYIAFDILGRLAFSTCGVEVILKK